MIETFGLDPKPIGSYGAPAPSDIDGDGDLDVFFRSSDVRLVLRNVASDLVDDHFESRHLSA